MCGIEMGKMGTEINGQNGESGEYTYTTDTVSWFLTKVVKQFYGERIVVRLMVLEQSNVHMQNLLM